MSVVKAVVYYRYGSPDVLSVQEVPKPVPKDTDIVIRVEAAEASKGDCELRSFNFPVKWFVPLLRLVMGVTKPRRPILGGYFSGVVAQCGSKVSRFAPGDPVFGSTGFGMGAYGEYLLLSEDASVALMPTNASFVQAAAIPMGGLNALHFMNKAQIQPGMKVLVNGAGGSIGSYVVQIAKARGAHVTAVDSGLKAAALLALGVDRFINYEQQDFVSENHRYDVVFDVVSHSNYKANLSVLTDTGHYLTANPRLSVMFQSVMTNRFTPKQATFSFAKESLEELSALKGLFETGAILPMIDKVYPMAQAADAHWRVETEQRLGIVVIDVSGLNGTKPEGN